MQVSKIEKGKPLKGELTKEAIIKAARKIFVKKGFSETKVDDIAKAAKVAKGTIYLYFKNKEVIFAEVILAMALPVRESIINALQDPELTVNKDPKLVLETILQNFSAYLHDVKHADVFVLLLREGLRFPKLVEFYHIEIIAPILMQLQKNLKILNELGDLPNAELVDYPFLFCMPAIFALVWNNIFGVHQNVDLKLMMKLHLHSYLGIAKKDKTTSLSSS